MRPFLVFLFLLFLGLLAMGGCTNDENNDGLEVITPNDTTQTSLHRLHS